METNQQLKSCIMAKTTLNSDFLKLGLLKFKTCFCSNTLIISTVVIF